MAPAFVPLPLPLPRVLPGRLPSPRPCVTHRRQIRSSLPDSTTSRTGGARGPAAASGDAPLLSPHAESLIAAQISRPIFDEALVPPPLGPICATAQAVPRFLSDPDLGALPPSPALRAALLLSTISEPAISFARAAVLAAHPGIDEPGGGLHPPFRAQACWRDFWQFLRVASYGVAAGGMDVLSDEGMDIMEQIYRELDVPLDALATGISALRDECARRAREEGGDDGEEMAGVVEGAFLPLISKLERFQ